MTVYRHETMPIMMLPLFTMNGIKRCNVSGCTENPTTMIADCKSDDGSATVDFSLCEHHYQESKAKGQINYKLDFD